VRFITNKEIAKLLHSVAAAYVVKGGDRFKIAAYEKAADSVEKATSELEDLWEENNLGSIPGIGESIKGHLDELFKKGNVRHFAEVKKGLPPAMFEFLDVSGMGPKTAFLLASKLNLKNMEDLENAAAEGKIRQLPGFGEKSEKEILTSIAQLKAKPSRFLLPFAFPVSKRVMDYLSQIKESEVVIPLGSLRRMVATIGDIDIAVASASPQKVINHFKKFKECAHVLGAGPMAASIVLKNGIQVDLKVLPKNSFGALLQHFTGSKNHNIKLREYALKKGMSLSEHGIKFRGKTLKFKDEKSFYNFLGMDYIEPELREETGEIEAAISHKLPKLLTLNEIKGDIHLHSSYPIEPSHDLGSGSFDDIIAKAQSLNYEYIGLSDHSPGASSHTKSQIIELIKKRTSRIEQIKSSVKNIRILNLLEIDILANGELSVPDEGLALLDGTIAGIHSSHGQDRELITKRILKACNSPYVQVIAHPTNRLLMERESSDANWPEIFSACVKTKTMLEINAWPNRLDLPDSLVKQAIVAGVQLVINTDSHDVAHMGNMNYGVSVARRGWATKENIANTLPWVEFKKMFRV
jgi:DNA polymerase (family 10)